MSYPAFRDMVTALTEQDWQMTEQQASEGDSHYEDAPYEYGAIVHAGAVLFTAGACPLDSEGSVVGLGDHVAQAGVALDNLTFALARFGVRLEDLAKITVYVVGGRSDLLAVWNVVAGGLAPHRPPSTLLGVSVLGYEGQLVEIEGIAAVPGLAQGD